MTERALEKLILYRLDELKAGLDDLHGEQLNHKVKLAELAVTVEHRVTALETKSSIRGAVSGAISSLLIAIAGAIIWLTQNL